MGVSGKAQVDAVMREAFGDREWWKSSSEQTFRIAARLLLDAGWHEHEAVDILSGLFAAVADEYGD